MIAPDDLLFIYELSDEIGDALPPSPESFIGLWNEDEFVYLFFLKEEDDYVSEVIRRTGATLTSRHVMLYADWQTGIPAAGVELAGVSFVPADSMGPARGAIRLDPSVVFGDGSHPTTVECLKLLKRIIDSTELSSLLDLGTGTGILALAASAMGMKRILAVDRNHLAVMTACRNVELNSLQSVIDVREGEARLFLDDPFDIVAANLPFQVLRDLCPLRGAGLHRFWIVSGVNRDQGKVIKELLAEQGYQVFHECATPPWVAFGMRRLAE